jgi:hypothetical protein
MSNREKNLLIFFAVAGFIVLNLLGIKYFSAYQTKIKGERQTAQAELQRAEMFLDSRDQVEDEMNWLAEHEPQPDEDQLVQTKLQQLAESEARNAGLTIKTGGQKLLPTDKTGPYYHRAKVEFTVNGSEQALYSWIGKLQIATDFRAVTFLRLMPNKEDDTKIDATLIIEQWFVPAPATF